MCRLYGFIATDPTRLECSLVNAQNALQVQSDRDQRGVRNADGWGIATWSSDGPDIIKSTEPAFADQDFAVAADVIRGTSVIAHVRAATVGSVKTLNTHPFTHGPWVFAHNGTLPFFEHAASHLDLGRFGPPHGETDSETVFRWLLNRMSAYGLDPDRPSDRLEPMVELLADSVLELVRISVGAGSDRQPALNLLLGDGRRLAASRFGNTLYWTHRQGIRDCGVCGLSHCPEADADYRASVIASEPITNERWHEVPEASVIGLESDGSAVRRDLSASPFDQFQS